MMRQLKIALCILTLACIGGTHARADSAISLISGFDEERLDASYPPSDQATLGELAKLLYRVRSIDRQTLSKIATDQGEASLGDARKVDGTVVGRTALSVPKDLVEFLEFKRIYVADISNDQYNARIISTNLSPDIEVGDRIQAVGIVVDVSSSENDSQPATLAIVSENLRWIPKKPQSVGQQLLSENGFDLGLLSSLASRSRQPLRAEDGDAFYEMLAVAGDIDDATDLPRPINADPVAILRDPKDLGGDWIHMDLETVQVTRIAVTEPRRQEQLGSDHYFQIDAVGDLGGVLIRIEAPDEGGSPATFRNRYPVSLVARDLPDFLQSRIESRDGDGAITSPIRMKCGVDGFFFRLWGYETDFMNQRGGGQQFGPLLVAAKMQNQEPTASDPAGVGAIGTIAALFILSAMLLIWFWQRHAWAGDDAARQRRQEHQSDQVQLPR